MKKNEEPLSKLGRITLPVRTDDRGTLVAAEIKDYVSRPVARFYYVTDAVKPRGGHAVKHEKKICIC